MKTRRKKNEKGYTIKEDLNMNIMALSDAAMASTRTRSPNKGIRRGIGCVAPESLSMLNMLAEVASVTLHTDPSVSTDETIFKPKAISPPSRKQSDCELLTLFQISSMTDNQLVKLFSEAESNEMSRRFTYTCYMLPAACDQFYQSFGNENKARSSIKAHLLSHVKSLLSVHTTPHSRQTFLLESIPAQRRRQNCSESIQATPKRKINKVSNTSPSGKNLGSTYTTPEKENESVNKKKGTGLGKKSLSAEKSFREVKSLKEVSSNNNLTMKNKRKSDGQDSAKSSKIRKAKTDEISMPIAFTNNERSKSLGQESPKNSKAKKIKVDELDMPIPFTSECKSKNENYESNKESKVKKIKMSEEDMPNEITYDDLNNNNNNNNLSMEDIKNMVKEEYDPETITNKEVSMIPAICHDHGYLRQLQPQATNGFYPQIRNRGCTQNLQLSVESGVEVKIEEDAIPTQNVYRNTLLHQYMNQELHGTYVTSGSESTTSNLPIVGCEVECIPDEPHQYLRSDLPVITEQIPKTSMSSEFHTVTRVIERDEYKARKKPKGRAKFIGQSKAEKEMALRLITEIRSQPVMDTLECKICQPPRLFTAPSTLLSHYRSHAGIRPYECRICEAVFTRQHSLNYHMLIHTNQTRFTCVDCGRKFRHPSHFKEHRRRHTGESPYECSDCLMRFKTRNTYKRHLRTRHGKLLTTQGAIVILSQEEADRMKKSQSRKPRRPRQPLQIISPETAAQIDEEQVWNEFEEGHDPSHVGQYPKETTEDYEDDEYDEDEEEEEEEVDETSQRPVMNRAAVSDITAMNRTVSDISNGMVKQSTYDGNNMRVAMPSLGNNGNTDFLLKPIHLEEKDKLVHKFASAKKVNNFDLGKFMKNQDNKHSKNESQEVVEESMVLEEVVMDGLRTFIFQPPPEHHSLPKVNIRSSWNTVNIDLKNLEKASVGMDKEMTNELNSISMDKDKAQPDTHTYQTSGTTITEQINPEEVITISAPGESQPNQTASVSSGSAESFTVKKPIKCYGRPGLTSSVESSLTSVPTLVQPNGQPNRCGVYVVEYVQGRDGKMAKVYHASANMVNRNNQNCLIPVNNNVMNNNNNEYNNNNNNISHINNNVGSIRPQVVVVGAQRPKHTFNNNIVNVSNSNLVVHRADKVIINKQVVNNVVVNNHIVQNGNIVSMSGGGGLSKENATQLTRPVMVTSRVPPKMVVQPNSEIVSQNSNICNIYNPQYTTANQKLTGTVPVNMVHKHASQSNVTIHSNTVSTTSVKDLPDNMIFDNIEVIERIVNESAYSSGTVNNSSSEPKMQSVVYLHDREPLDSITASDTASGGGRSELVMGPSLVDSASHYVDQMLRESSSPAERVIIQQQPRLNTASPAQVNPPNNMITLHMTS